MKISILGELNELKTCWVCGTPQNIHKHHIFGGPNRKISEKHGMTVNLCMEHHTGNNGVHFNKTLDLQLKQMAQRNFELLFGHDEFMKAIGRNYLDEMEVSA